MNKVVLSVKLHQNSIFERDELIYLEMHTELIKPRNIYPILRTEYSIITRLSCHGQLLCHDLLKLRGS
jgi:hypothetical protein